MLLTVFSNKDEVHLLHLAECKGSKLGILIPDITWLQRLLAKDNPLGGEDAKKKKKKKFNLFISKIKKIKMIFCRMCCFLFI